MLMFSFETLVRLTVKNKALRFSSSSSDYQKLFFSVTNISAPERFSSTRSDSS